MSLSSQKLQRALGPPNRVADDYPDPFAMSPEQEHRFQREQLIERRRNRRRRGKQVVGVIFDLLLAAAFAAAIGMQTFALMHTMLTN